jgi:16S rRNA processing protein RimM
MNEQLVSVGRVGRPHGLDGAFVVEDASDDPVRFAVEAMLWVDGEEARVVASKRTRGKPVVRLDRAVTRGSDLAVPRSTLVPPGPDAFYVFQLVGLDVEEVEGGHVLGRVSDVVPGVANDVLELDTGLLLPMHEACVRGVDLAAGKIVVARGFRDHG